MRGMTVLLALMVVMMAMFAAANTCGGNCPSNTCTSCPCGSSPNRIDIAGICSKFGWNQRCCQCIVGRESGGNANAANRNTNGSFDIGVFQINDYNWNSCSGGAAPCDVNVNLGCAKKVYGWGGNTWKFWSTCGACGCC